MKPDQRLGEDAVPLRVGDATVVTRDDANARGVRGCDDRIARLEGHVEALEHLADARWRLHTGIAAEGRAHVDLRAAQTRHQIG